VASGSRLTFPPCLRPGHWLTLLSHSADYGESSYIGPIDGAQPRSQSWVDGFDHSALQQINAYYAAAFKTGSYPAITQDKVYLMARPHPAFANAYADSVGPPTGREYSQDNMYALVFATSPSTVTLSSGAGSQSFSVNAGVTRLQHALAAGGGMSAKITRNGADVVDFSPNFTFNGNPAVCACLTVVPGLSPACRPAS
jgi:glucan endo-1,3-alpha-glucosidase